METEYKVGDVWEGVYGGWKNKENNWEGHRSTFKVLEILKLEEELCNNGRIHPAGEYARCEILEVKELPEDLNRRGYRVGDKIQLRNPYNSEYNNKRLISRT